MAFAKLGGHTMGISQENENDGKKLFNGQYSVQSVSFKLDRKPPEHCFPSCNIYPIYLEEDITNVSSFIARWKFTFLTITLQKKV